ncbi:MAG TPA: polymer-forming cytoskeletal protein [Methanocorpusculum sp.]|nr:polymer-forming cytoskeletal protein [Methanocorpusculum sp.]
MMQEKDDRIITAESADEEERYLRIPDLTPEEEAALDEESKMECLQSEVSAEEPLFSEVGISKDSIQNINPEKIDEESAAYLVSSSDLFKNCVLPEKTELQERLIKTKHDILVGDHCHVGYGLYGNDVIVCELCVMEGDVIAEGDLRIDNFCEIYGTVLCNGDAYLGEGVKIHGKLSVGGNLDIGDNVSIDKEFKAYGDIAIRNPMPVILYLLLYVMTLLNIEGEDSAKKKMEKMISETNTVPLVLPPRTNISLEYFSVPTAMEIGANSRLHGNIRAKSIRIRKDATIFGSVNAAERVKIGPRDAVHGDVHGRNVRIERGADILGDVSGNTVWLHEDARISGIIRAEDGLTIGGS